MKQKEMSFLDHLEELRWLLIRSTGVIVFFAIIAFIFKRFIFDRLIFAFQNPNFITYRFLCRISKLLNADGLCLDEVTFTIQSLKMAEQFSAHIWMSLTFGFIFAFPYLIYEIWKFLKPALYTQEQKHAKSFIFFSSFLFFFGILFGYFVLAPLTINFFGNYSVSDVINRNFKLSSYIAIVKTATLSSGILFELPIVIYFLTKLGLVTPNFLKKNRKYAMVIILILAGIITPGDILSLVIVSIPMLFLYEFGIFISKRIVKRQKTEIVKE
jgi:sec-independent protein translocase protein TatC